MFYIRPDGRSQGAYITLPMDDCYADVFFYGGNIIVMDEDDNEAEALAVKDGKIIAVGKYTELINRRHVGPNTQIIKLIDDQILLPGFIEAHTHAVHMVNNRCIFENVSGFQFSCYEEMKNVITTKVREAASVTPVQSCAFFGWDPELIFELPELSADKIDAEFCQDLPIPIPIIIVGQNFHVAWANQTALDKAKICSENPPDGFGSLENGKLSGKIFETPNIFRVLKCMRALPDLDTIKKAMREQWRDYASRGFTTVTDLWFLSNDMIKEALSDVASEEYCPIRLALYEYAGSPPRPPENQTAKPEQLSCCLPPLVKSTDVATHSASLAQSFKDNNKLWVAGVKLCADGSPHCGTMAVDAPFLSNNLTEKLGFPTDDYPCGKLNYRENEELFKIIKHNHDRKEQPQIAIHAHGERAIDQVLSLYKEVDPPENGSDRRYRIEHLGLMTEEQIIRAAEQNLALSFFVCQLHIYGKTFTDSIFGPDRTNRWTPLALAKKHGLYWTIHQDHPAFPGTGPTPLINLKAAVTRTLREPPHTVYGPEHCVPIHDAIKAYTINAAWQLHVEKELGSLEVGKLADLLILDKSPYKVDAMKLEDIKVVETFLGGKRTGLADLQDQVLMSKN